MLKTIKANFKFYHFTHFHPHLSQATEEREKQLLLFFKKTALTAFSKATKLLLAVFPCAGEGL